MSHEDGANPSRVLEVAFVRTVGEADRLYVKRSDGTEAHWSAPTYGDALPHDLIHLVVESAFDLSRGFWGRVDEGVDPKIVSDQANRKGGADKYAAYGADQAELVMAEALATAPWSEERVDAGIAEAFVRMRASDPPVQVSAERIREVRAVLAALTTRWRDLRPKGSLNLTFDRTAPRRGFETMLEAAGLHARRGDP